jgi:RNA polymerase sigma-70 factor (ECF subfamily)
MGATAEALTRDLYTRYGAQVQSYCFRRLRSREEAEDAVQTTFLNALRALQRGTMPHAEQAWLYKIASHVCSGRSLTPLAELPETVPAPARAEAEELMGLDEALDAMPDNQRRAILLREWRGLSYREIADELELSQTAVEMLIFRARKSLARTLEAPAAETAAFATA